MPQLKLICGSILFIAVALLTACDSRNSGAKPPRGSSPDAIAERIDNEEALEAVRLQPVTDPVVEKIEAYRKQMADYFYAQKFDELEKEAASARTSKDLFGNGSWKIAQFYGAFERQNNEAPGIWNVTEETLKAWLKASPNSLTVHIAYADFLTSYAWYARGSGYADTVTSQGWRLMKERLQRADEFLTKALKLPEKDPFLYLVALRVALGNGLDKQGYDKLMEKARAAEPMFWGYDVARAISLLPRWYGEKGDWETFAAKAADRSDGPGIEVYARIVMCMVNYHQNIFQESQASWPKTKEGLEILLQKYPDSVDLLSYGALLATCAFDNKAAKDYFDKLGDRYLEKSSVWPSKESFVHYRKWARTGKW